MDLSLSALDDTNYRLTLDYEKSQYAGGLDFELWKGVDQIWKASSVQNDGKSFSYTFSHDGTQSYPLDLQMCFHKNYFEGTFTRNIGEKQYELTDHLGNVRAVVGARLKLDGKFPQLIATTNYYPFGMTINSLSNNSEKYRYGFNGKEKDDQGEWGMTYYDYGFRIYNPGIARFLSVDPKAELAPGWTPYRAFFNNPLRFIDLDGQFEIDKKTAEKYPEFAKYLQNVAENFENQSQEFKDAFYETSGLSAEQTKDMLTYGKGPKINVMNLDGKDRNGDGKPDKVNGQAVAVRDSKGNIKPANDGKGLIRLDDDVVGMLENAQNMGEKQVGTIMVESTLLHEGTHFGNYKVNGKFKESGKALETKAYGKDIGRSNVKKYWESKQLKPLKPIVTPIIIK